MFDETTLALEVPPPSLDAILRQAGIEIMGGPTEWGSSWWGAFLKCPLEGALIKEAGWPGEFKDYFFYGGLFHECMARVYEGLDVLEPVRAVQGWAQQNAAGVWQDHAAEIHAIASNVADCVVAYMGYWRQMPAGQRFDFDALGRYQIPASEIIGIEMVLRSEEPFPYTSKVDLVTRLVDWLGRPCVVLLDHKTTQDPKGDWTEAWWQDAQMMGGVYLWNKTMVPQGYPPARYYCINGIVRPSGYNRLRHPAFVRNTYPVRDSSVALWVQSMMAANEQRIRCERTRQKCQALQEPYQLHDVYPQNWAACFSRRYGRGRCGRLDYCLGLVPTGLPAPAQTAAPPPAPQAPVPHPAAPGEAPPTAPVAEAPPDSPSVGAEAPSPGATPPVRMTVPCPKEKGAVISISRQSEPPIPASQTKAGETYYVKGTVVWGLGEIENDDQGDPNVMFLISGGVRVGYAPDSLCFPCTPILKDDKTPPPPKPEPKEDAPAPELGKAFLAGVGEVSVHWLGSFNSGGKRLVTRLDQVSTEPCFGLARVGRDPAKRSMRVLVRKPDAEGPAESKKTELGSDLWTRLEGMLPFPPPVSPEAKQEEDRQEALPGTEA